MASFSYFPTIIFFLAILISTTNGIHLPIQKDTKTSQFYTTIHMGSNRTAVNTVIDLGGRFLWFVCDNYTSTTLVPLNCNSTQCGAAGGRGCSFGPNDTCGSGHYNPFADFLVADDFYQDTLSLKNNNIPQYLFSCMRIFYADGLGGGSTGLLALGRTPVSFIKQVAGKLNLPDVFSLCLPSSGSGKLTIGERSKNVQSLKSTPLIINPQSFAPVGTGGASAEYFIDVRSIRVNGKTIAVNSSYFAIESNGNGGTLLSTVRNYTIMNSFIYRSFSRAFVKAASDMKIRRAAAVAPFGVCFRSDSISRTAAGPVAPAIDLVLGGTDVYWRINGGNSLVEVDERTMCLGFMDAGERPRHSIQIGVHQLEENFMEMDMVSSQLRFSNSLLEQSKSCSSL